MKNEEIRRIKDTELREIRSKYWEMKSKIFLDETNISDCELCILSKEYEANEINELEIYKNNHPHN